MMTTVVAAKTVLFPQLHDKMLYIFLSLYSGCTWGEEGVTAAGLSKTGRGALHTLIIGINNALYCLTNSCFLSVVTR